MSEHRTEPTMPKDEEKRQAARAALRYIEGCRVIGVGTGSTVAHFIDALAERKDAIDGTVSSSDQSTQLLVERDQSADQILSLRTAIGPDHVRTGF
jgi:ribose 5-phosphate isomerase